MDLGTLSLTDGNVPESRTGGSIKQDNSIVEAWLKAAIETGPKAVTVPGEIVDADGKLRYAGEANDIINRLRRAVETYNAGQDQPENHIGLRLNVVEARKKGNLTINFATKQKTFRPRKAAATPTAE